MEEQPVFFLELTDPWSYLAAERVMAELPVIPEWEPVQAEPAGAELAAVDRESFATRAQAAGLLPVRWPPGAQEGRLAAAAAAYAKGGGRTVNFCLALLRQQFAAGRDPDEEATVLLAAAACEMHPAAVLKGVQLRATAQRMERAQLRARALGVDRLPAIATSRRAFCGPDCLEQATAALVGRPE